jgi:molecular chaperone DnaJ
MPATERDYYEILGVLPTASQREIKRAFRRLALLHHPDRNPHNKKSEEKFKEIAEAYGILNNPQKRNAYDEHTAQAPRAADDVSRSSAGSDFNGPIPSNDLLRDVFRDILGYPIRGRQKGQKGEDLRYHLSITFEEAALGRQVEIKIPSYTTCPACRGLKMKPGSRLKQCPLCKGKGRAKAMRRKGTPEMMCKKCGGKGKVARQPCACCSGAGRMEQTCRIAFSIPPGVRTGSRLKVLNRGNPGSNGGPAGDLYIVLNVNPHPFLERDGDDIVFHLDISFSQASLGGRVTVPTLDGEVEMDIPPGTQPGDVLRLKHRGIPSPRGAGRGDQQIVIQVTTPSRLTSRQKNLLKQFARMG